MGSSCRDLLALQIGGSHSVKLTVLLSSRKVCVKPSRACQGGGRWALLCEREHPGEPLGPLGLAQGCFHQLTLEILDALDHLGFVQLKGLWGELPALKL